MDTPTKLVLSVLLLLGVVHTLRAGRQSKPNIVIVFTDDQGYQDLESRVFRVSQHQNTTHRPHGQRRQMQWGHVSTFDILTNGNANISIDTTCG